MVDVADLGLAVGDERGDHERRAAAQVGAAHRRTRELRHAAHERVMTLDADVGAHAADLVGEHEAVLEHVLGDDAVALGDRHERHELRLHVGGKAGVWQRLHVDRREPAGVRSTVTPSGSTWIDAAGLLELDEHEVEVRRGRTREP